MWVTRLAAAAALTAPFGAGNWTLAGDGFGRVPVAIYVDDASAAFRSTSVLVSTMLQEAGVEIEWFRSSQWNGEHKIVIFVRLREARAISSRTALAFTAPLGGDKKVVTVYTDRVRIVSRAAGVRESTLLAHVLVHEIGHVLERTDRHSNTGVMKEYWTRADLDEMAVRPLHFGKEDIEWIRMTLAELREQRERDLGK